MRLSELFRGIRDWFHGVGDGPDPVRPAFTPRIRNWTIWNNMHISRKRAWDRGLRIKTQKTTHYLGFAVACNSGFNNWRGLTFCDQRFCQKAGPTETGDVTCLECLMSRDAFSPGPWAGF